MGSTSDIIIMDKYRFTLCDRSLCIGVPTAPVGCRIEYSMDAFKLHNFPSAIPLPAPAHPFYALHSI